MEVLPVDFDVCRTMKIDGQCRLFFFLLVQYLFNVL